MVCIIYCKQGNQSSHNQKLSDFSLNFARQGHYSTSGFLKKTIYSKKELVLASLTTLLGIRNNHIWYLFFRDLAVLFLRKKSRVCRQRWKNLEKLQGSPTQPPGHSHCEKWISDTFSMTRTLMNFEFLKIIRITIVATRTFTL